MLLTKNGSCQQNTSWHPVMKMSSSANVESVLSKAIQEILWIFRVYPVLRKLTHLPIIVDPSHAGGKWWLVDSMAMAAIAAGADGLMIEVHNDPESALCDGAQSLKPNKYDELLKQVAQIANVVGKSI